MIDEGKRMKNSKWDEIKSYLKLHKNIQVMILVFLLVVISLLGMNDNYHTEIWVNRILPPIQTETVELNWGGLVLVIATYHIFERLYVLKGIYIFDKRWKCFLCVLIFCAMIDNINIGVVQRLKSIQTGLNAVYLKRDKVLGVNIYEVSAGEEKTYRAEGYVVIKNCSDKSVGPFNITIVLPESKEGPSGRLTSDKTYQLEPGEQRTVDLNYEGKLNSHLNGEMPDDEMYLVFERVRMILWDEDEQVTFYAK